MRQFETVVLASDISGYSHLMNVHERETLQRLPRYEQVFITFVQRAGGRIFNTAGDAILAEFSNAGNAIRAAVRIQQEIARINDSCPEFQPILFRIGLNWGKVYRYGVDLLGDTVNIASRLESVAEPGQICLSQSFVALLSKNYGLSIIDIGLQSVKNIADPIPAFKVDFDKSSLPSVYSSPFAFRAILCFVKSTFLYVYGLAWICAALALLMFPLSALILLWYAHGVATTRMPPQKIEHVSTEPYSSRPSGPDQPQSATVDSSLSIKSQGEGVESKGEPPVHEIDRSVEAYQGSYVDPAVMQKSGQLSINQNVAASPIISTKTANSGSSQTEQAEDNPVAAGIALAKMAAFGFSFLYEVSKIASESSEKHTVIHHHRIRVHHK